MCMNTVAGAVDSSTASKARRLWFDPSALGLFCVWSLDKCTLWRKLFPCGPVMSRKLVHGVPCLHPVSVGIGSSKPLSAGESRKQDKEDE